MSSGRFTIAWLIASTVALTPTCFANRNAYIPYFTAPVQNYAVIDLSATTATSPVTSVALDDSNNAAFCFDDGGPAGTEYSYTWQNGTLSPNPASSLDLAHFAATEYPDYYQWQLYKITNVFPDGTLAGGSGVDPGEYDSSYPPTPPLTPEGYLPNYDGGGFAYFGGEDVSTPGPFGTNATGILDSAMDASVFSADGTCAVFSSDSSDLYVNNQSYSWPTSGVGANGDGTISFAFIPGGVSADGSTAYFYGGGMSASLPAGSLNGFDIIPQEVNFFGINNIGWACGVQSDGTAVLWNRQVLLSLGTGTAADLNDQNQVVVQDYTPFGGIYTSGYLWDNNVTTTLWEQIPAWIDGQYSAVQPESVSNQVTPAPASGSTSSSTDTTIHILAAAAGLDVGAYGEMVWTRGNNGKWTFANIALPQGTTITDWTTINSSGVIAAIGNAGTGNGHALLLVPVTVTLMTSPFGQNVWNDLTSTLLSPTVYVQASVLPMAGVTFTVTVVQDINTNITAMYTDGSSTTVQTSTPFPEAAPGFIADDPSLSANQTVLFYDNPILTISTSPRDDLHLIRFHSVFHDFVTVQVNGGPAQVVAETGWLLNMGEDFSWVSPTQEQTPVLQITPNPGVTIYGGAPIDSMVSPRTPTANSYVFGTPSDWHPNGLPGDLATQYPFPPVYP